MPGISESPRVDKDGRFRELDKLRSADGMVGVISQRVETGVITFMIVREFPQSGSGEMQKTSFIPEHMLHSYVQMAETIGKRIAQLRLENKVPPAVRSRRG